MIKSEFLRAGVCSIAMALALVGCASEPSSNGNTTEGVDEGVSNEGGNLVVAVLSDATSLDPHTSSDVPSGNVQSNIYQTLVKYNTDMELEPLLAEEWT
ncbi:ABC transporter substrate-binding protein, partial [Bacillus sp. LL01]